MAAQAVAPASSAKCPVQLKASESETARGGRLLDQVAAVDEAPCFVILACACEVKAIPFRWDFSEIAVLSGSSPPRPSAVVMVQSVLCIYTTYIPRPEYQINGDNTGSLRCPIAFRLYFSRFCRKRLHVMRALDLERDGPARFERRKCCYSSFLLLPFLGDWGTPAGLGLALPGLSLYFSKKNIRKRPKKETLTAVEKIAVRLSPEHVPWTKAYATTTMPVKN